MNSLLSRVRDIQLSQQKAAPIVKNRYEDALKASPSCPPDKRLRVHGGPNFCSWNRGDASWDYAEHRVYTVPNLVADLSDPDSVYTTVTFSNAGWYKSYFFCLRLPAVAEEPTVDDWSFYLHGTEDEFKTTTEAEMWTHRGDFLNHNYLDRDSSMRIGSTYQLCGVILRNDGRTGIAGAILPIDVINRGRSYVWPRDIRPRLPMDS